MQKAKEKGKDISNWFSGSVSLPPRSLHPDPFSPLTCAHPAPRSQFTHSPPDFIQKLKFFWKIMYGICTR